MNKFMFIRVCTRARIPDGPNGPAPTILVQTFRIKMRMECNPFYYWDANVMLTKEYSTEEEALLAAERLAILNNCDHSQRVSYNVPDTHIKLTNGDLELLALYALWRSKDEPPLIR